MNGNFGRKESLISCKEKNYNSKFEFFVFCAMFNGIFYFTINRINSVRDWQYFYPEINLDSSIPFVWWTIVTICDLLRHIRFTCST